ncbi:predicted protein [Chaetoceros tenuissimus]|uniref:Uncharacterized protein n=1 Tax=Chaetoceros tenuissimus TaxID=426638 RepID=A0AAD3D3U4_9STRA|nr:predicted protein [Chaetoceros tenuissimus]
MASRIISIVRVFGSRPGQVTNPNWAILSAWRRYLGLEVAEHVEEKAQEQDQIDAYNGENEYQSHGQDFGSTPITSEYAIRTRNEFLMESHRRMREGISSSMNISRNNVQSSRRTEEEILERPNLDIVVNGVSCTIAQ